MSRFHSAISHLNLNSRSGSAATVVVGLQRRSQAAVTKTAIEGSDNIQSWQVTPRNTHIHQHPACLRSSNERLPSDDDTWWKKIYSQSLLPHRCLIVQCCRSCKRVKSWRQNNHSTKASQQRVSTKTLAHSYLEAYNMSRDFIDAGNPKHAI